MIKTITLADTYDSERTAKVRARVGVDGKLYLDYRQYHSACYRSRMMPGSVLVCITPLSQSEIIVYKGSSPHAFVRCAVIAPLMPF